jgi:hypothetical protein
LVVAALFVLALDCAGCAGDQPQEQGSAPAVEGSAASAVPSPMPSEDKEALMPPGFPPEIPVLDATVLSVGEETVEGRSVWHYELASRADAGAVADWYRTAYSGANWSLVEDTADDDGGVLVFAKGNGIETVLTVESADGGSSVRASVGFGVSLSGAV